MSCRVSWVAPFFLAWTNIQETYTVNMTVKRFYLLGEPSSTTRNVEFEGNLDFEGLQHWIAGQFAIVDPNGMFHGNTLRRQNKAFKL